MQITVNGELSEVRIEPARSLLELLREELGLTEAKYGCGEGACGACTVLVDGSPTHSCVTALADVDGRTVLTLEGLATDSTKARLERAFADECAFQCAYCTPGMIVSATALLRHDPKPDEAQIVTEMDGNICRCGTYPRIVRAIHAAAAAASDAQLEAAEAAEASAPPASPPARAGRPWDLTQPEDRDWFDRLGPGLVVVLAPDEVERMEEKTGTGWSTPGGAWLHVAPTGTVTAFTGKVDVGQGNRHSLQRLVAAELGVATGSVTIVMGDTDVTPYDIGTFGSRSMADAGTCLRIVAATARQAMAETGEPPADKCAVRFCRAQIALRHDIARRLAELPQTSTRRPMQYTSDLRQAGMLHGRVLRPPSFAARLASVDTTRAEAVAGATVLHEDDFVGVAAADPSAARAALRAIDATWDEAGNQPSVTDLEAYLRGHPVDEEGWEGNVDEVRGDPRSAFAKAANSCAATYRASYLAHVPLETRAAIAQFDPAGMLSVWTGTQRPFGVREELAEALGMNEEDVRVIVPPTGSGYGGKHSGEAAIEAARLARAAGRPVKVRWTRPEEFTSAYFRPAAVIDVRSASDADGRLSAWEQVNTNSGPRALDTPYDVPNVRVAYQAAASPLRQGSWRALSASANCFARESQMDELARDLGVDPLEFRLRHLADERLAAVLRAAAEHIGWPSAPAGADGAEAGMGIACGIEKEGRVATGAVVRIGAGGVPRLLRLVTAYDCGLIVDRANLVNQVEGAQVMGLSAALFEGIDFEDGRLRNGSMTDYRVARFSDVPQIEVVLIDRPQEPPAGGGETPIIAVAPAIANAIFTATGRRLRSLPLLAGW